MLWEASPVMSTLCLCGLAACGGRSPSRGPKLSPWSRRHRWPPVARHTGRSALPPRGPWGRVNTDLNQCPRRAAWHHEIHWPPCMTQTQTVRKVTVAQHRYSGEIQEWMREMMSTGAVISSNHREFNSCLNNEARMHGSSLLWQWVTHSITFMFIHECRNKPPHLSLTAALICEFTLNGNIYYRLQEEKLLLEWQLLKLNIFQIITLKVNTFINFHQLQDTSVRTKTGISPHLTLNFLRAISI